MAELLGQEAGLFLPSGTMCNQIALRLHARPGGDELILDRTAHPIIAEAGGPAWNAGLMIHALDGHGGIFSGDAGRAAVRPQSRYMPRSRVVSVEQTTNMGGGRVWALDAVHDVLAAAREHGLRTHLDGARLMNAVVASGVSAAEYAGGFDTAWLDFTKASAPRSARCSRARALIEEAWRWKQQMGGAFRQSGIVAAGCLYALDHNVERLADDHANARRLADGLAELGVEVVPRDQHRHLRGAARIRGGDGAPRGGAERHSRRPRAGGHAPGRKRHRRRCGAPGGQGRAANLTRRGEGLCTCARRAPRSGTAAATRWWPPSGASTRPAEGPHRRRGHSPARVRLHSLPEGRQGPQARLAALGGVWGRCRLRWRSFGVAAVAPLDDSRVGGIPAWSFWARHNSAHAGLHRAAGGVLAVYARQLGPGPSGRRPGPHSTH